MTMIAPLAERRWRYTAVDRAGRRVRDVVRAVDVRAAARVLAGEGLTPLSFAEDTVKDRAKNSRGLKLAERVLVLRQLALMIEAGVGLLEALQTVVAGIEAERGRAELEAVAIALTRGDSFAHALQANAPGFPFYVYAMSRVGEATGRIAEVMRDAAEQMAYEDRLRRDFINAMTYPAFLLTAGFGAVMFIFTQVVPRFAALIGDKRTNMPLASRLILDIGLWSNSHLLLVLAGLGGLGAAIAAAVVNPRLRRIAYDVGHRVPVIGDLLKAREITAWARLTGFALGNGVLLLDAAVLSRQAAPEGPFRRGLEQFERDIKAGVAVDVSLGRHTRLTGMDLSLLRAGQKSGTLPRMYGFLADGYDARLRDLMKRLTALVEPIAIGAISILVGVVALSLILALSSVYDNVS